MAKCEKCETQGQYFFVFVIFYCIAKIHCVKKNINCHCHAEILTINLVTKLDLITDCSLEV